MYIKKATVIESSYPCHNSTSCYPLIFTLSPGYYYFEAWAAKGGGTKYNCAEGVDYVDGGKGGYTAGKLHITSTQTFYAYIGQKGTSYPNQDLFAYNGGGCPIRSGGGGGGTDFRLVGGNASSPESYNTRILVAGGGGGGDCGSPGGDGGGLFGGNSVDGGFGGNQTAGGYGTDNSGEMWMGGSAKDDNTGGGGGYFGGGTGVTKPGGFSTGAGGGSGYISGHQSCTQYQNIVFTDTILLSGSDNSIPSPPENEDNERLGDGSIRVSLIINIHFTCHQNLPQIGKLISIFICILK